MGRHYQRLERNKGIFTAFGLNLVAWGIYSVCLSVMEDRFSPQAWQPGGVSAPLRAVHNALVYLSYGIGFTQLFHIVPWVTRLVVQRQFERANGVMIGALITALLCGGCFVLFFPYLTAQSTMFWR